jgi:hypothetical protein
MFAADFTCTLPQAWWFISAAVVLSVAGCLSFVGGKHPSEQSSAAFLCSSHGLQRKSARRREQSKGNQ